MNSLYKRLVVDEVHGCHACHGDREDIGPVNGPKPPPWRVDRWSMTPAEWIGQTA